MNSPTVILVAFLSNRSLVHLLGNGGVIREIAPGKRFYTELFIQNANC